MLLNDAVGQQPWLEYQVNRMNQTQDNGYIFEKKIIHKVLDDLKSNFDHEYLRKEKIFWYAFFSADLYWYPLHAEQKWAKTGELGR